jgi:hypothetical protein
MSNSLTSVALPDDLIAFLGEVETKHIPAPRGRLIFGLDATASRQPTWDMAASLTAGMFREAQGLDCQLAYYRGDRECRASVWVSEPDRLVKMMTKIMCEAGMTQIGRILAHAKTETTKLPVNALVFIGDACEESPVLLRVKAHELKIPVFMFHEGPDERAGEAFRDITRRTGGAYARFDAGAAQELGELLKAVAVFATSGLVGLEAHKEIGQTRLLLEQLRRTKPGD